MASGILRRQALKLVGAATICSPCFGQGATCETQLAGLVGCRPTNQRWRILSDAASGDPNRARDIVKERLDELAGSAPPTTGDTYTDRAFGLAIGKLARFTRQKPDFILFDDDSEQLAAFAINGSRQTSTSGSVLLKKAKFKQVFTDPTMKGHGDVAIMLILAHEFAHIAQFNSPHHARLMTAASCMTKLVELHADFLAGFYLAEETRSNPSIDSDFAIFLMRTLGDDKLIKPIDPHGTAAERLHSVSSGYAAGIRGGVAYTEAMQLGADFVVKTFH